LAGRRRSAARETIEETGELIAADHGRLDVLINDIFGGDRYAQFGTKVWEHDLPGGLRMIRMGIDTHLYGFTDTDGTQPDCWRYIVEVQDADLPGDDGGYG